MDIDAFSKKVYTAAFRLTGEEKVASDIAICAIERTIKKLNIHKRVPSNMIEKTTKEVCKIFLEELHTYTSYETEYPFISYEEQKKELEQLQEAILTLEPIKRVTIIWRDVLGFKLAKIISTVNCTEKELYRELTIAHRQIKDKLDMVEILN